MILRSMFCWKKIFRKEKSLRNGSHSSSVISLLPVNISRIGQAAGLACPFTGFLQHVIVVFRTGTGPYSGQGSRWEKAEAASEKQVHGKRLDPISAKDRPYHSLHSPGVG